MQPDAFQDFYGWILPLQISGLIDLNDPSIFDGDGIVL